MAGKSPIKLKTENEILLYNYYTEEKANREKLECLVQDLKKQVESLQLELKNTQEQNALLKEQTSPITTTVSTDTGKRQEQYETDEEELAKETEWVRKISRKKRKLNSTLSPPPQQGTNSNGTAKEEKVRKVPLPPPIVVENIMNYQQFYDLLSASIAKDTFIVKMMNGDTAKINANNEDAYRAITKLLHDNKSLWHSYENKQDRPIRVMAKNLHSSCSPERIVEDLACKGLKIVEAVNKLSWRNKQPLNMFMLSFQKDEDINNIYNIKSILGCKVDIQPIKTSRLIPQCKRCQAYGHTQKYCAKEPRCVKCTGKHLTKDCKKPAEDKPKCVHCGEPHPASYRGCIVAKELQALKNKSVKKNVAVTTSSASSSNANKGKNANNQNSVTKQVTKTLSFAHVTKGAQPSQQPQLKPASSDTDTKINKILDLLTSFDNRLKKLEKQH